MTKKVVISGYYGFDNFGDETILTILVNHLKTLNSDITVFSANPEKTSERLSVNTVNSFDYLRVIQTILKTDFLISGGGSLLQDVTSLKSLVYYLGIIFLAILFGKKVIIFAQGIGPINNKFAKFITLLLLKKCKHISVRDNVSHEFLTKNNIKSKQVCDPVFSLDIPSNNHSQTVGIQLRDFKTVTNDFLNQLAIQVNKNFSDKKIQILSLQDITDLEISKKFQNILLSINPNLNTEIIFGKTNEEIITCLSQLEYLIAMRFHALLTALKAGVKSMGINYDIKVQTLANEMNIPLLSLDIQNNFEQMFEDLKNSDSDKIKSYADGKVFDFTEFDKIFTT